jgi:hypothetical protein
MSRLYIPLLPKTDKLDAFPKRAIRIESKSVQ